MNSARRILAIVSIAVIAAVLSIQAVSASTTGPPILWVHGSVSSGGCPSVSKTQDAALVSMMSAIGYTGPVRMVGYYCGETGFADYIPGAGDPSYFPTGLKNYNTTTPIEKLANDLAWYVFKHYSQYGQPVSFAAHSMGGLIIRFALQMTQAGDSHFPPYLLVSNVWSYSSPYDGADKTPTYVWNTTGCGSYKECQEMLPGSAFLKELQTNLCPQAQGGTDFTTEGGGPADNVDSYASSSDISCAHRVDYFSKTPVNYNHTNGLTDKSTLLNEPRTITQPDGTATTANGEHSLLLAREALTSTSI